MKEKTKNTSASKKLIPAVAMLTTSAIMLSSATYAWFTMNKEVEVTGMSLTTTVGSNLLISPDTAEGNFKPALLQNVSALLEPVSTIDGISYDYTINAAANGAALDNATFGVYSEDTALENTFANKTKYDDDFNGVYGQTVTVAAADAPAYGYIDYAFYLKATNTENSASKINMTDCNLLYNNGTVTEKSWRAAMFVQDLGDTCSEGVAPGEPSGATLRTILTPEGAVNQEVGKARNASTHNLETVTYNANAQVEDAIDVNTTQYYYVVVRVWLEGEDTTCTSATYANLTKAWKLDLKFEIAGKDAVGKINSVVPAVPGP
ncbi:hypothetical protein [uncultured Ruminococcus sp.]|uniref:hypothetical protein n=1 Tax=uncultured Ruminococcus sp. TaxID=165186 RepID=UPI002942EEFF|nr:hypothetical protein [uncultured Ruminococcus sp.]